MTTTKSTRSELARLRLRITGSWEVSRFPAWRGKAKAEEPVVGILFVSDGQTTSWIKMNRGNATAPQLVVSLCPHETCREVTAVCFDVGTNARGVCTLRREVTPVPNIPSETIQQTGELVTICRIEGNPTILLRVLFLACRDVKVGRNRIWHLKEGLDHKLSESIVAVLSSGRTGILEGAL
jgi:hypothetical protein